MFKRLMSTLEDYGDVAMDKLTRKALGELATYHARLGGHRNDDRIRS
jgi:hypothetical protein